MPLNMHLSVLIIFLLTATAVPLIWLIYDRGRDVAIAGARERMQLLTQRTADRYEIVFDSVEPFATMAALSEAFATPLPDDLDRKQQTFIGALRSSAYIDDMYVGYPDGAFLQAVNLAANAAWRTALNAPKDAAFAVQVVTRDAANRLMSSWRFLNEAGSELSATQLAVSSYDPRTRAWYQNASTVRGTVAIGPHLTTMTRSLALTVARAHHDDRRIVIGVDIFMATVAQFLLTEKVSPRSTAYVLDGFGRLVIHPDPATLDQLQQGSSAPTDETGVDPVYDAVHAAMANVSRQELSYLRFEANGEPYVGSATEMKVSPSLEGNTLVIAAPLSDFTQESQRLLRHGVLISAGLLAVGVAAAVIVARLIARSLSALTAQAAKLGDLDFRYTSVPSSSIMEINSLAGALAMARDAIRSFALYVPRELVRKIVANGAIATETAVREEISVIFTDIRDFISISEKTSPEEVVSMLSAYFDEINKCVEANNGTIIQFLGDSVYAMWNAPIGDPDHVCHACKCALDIAGTVERFNIRQAALGKPELVTRIGLHTGSAVVGNVGAASRLQYTAMGDTVNVASRLEGINKEFGTTIMVSRAIVDRCADDFIFTPLGTKLAKGRREQLEIFELVAARTGSHSCDAKNPDPRPQP